MSVTPFGTVAGAEIVEVTIGSEAGAQARIITWGAVLRDLVVPSGSGMRPVVLGLPAIEEYVRLQGNFGAIVGRYANRIGGGRFRLDGREVRLEANENRTTLHGGPHGFGRQVWSLLGHDARSVHLALVSPDGDGGFPGRLFATCSYEMLEPATLRLTLQAITDRATPLNLSTHTYYNLDGTADIREHMLRIEAGHITPTDAELIPTGEIRPVAGTGFDFRQERTIRAAAVPGGYDMNFVLAGERDAVSGLRRAATLASAASRVRLDLWTSEPGIQLYDGARIAVPATSHGGVPLGAFSGVALEPQRFPDGPNQAHFPPCILRPGEVSRQVSELRFSVDP